MNLFISFSRILYAAYEQRPLTNKSNNKILRNIIKQSSADKQLVEEVSLLWIQFNLLRIRVPYRSATLNRVELLWTTFEKTPQQNSFENLSKILLPA